MPSREEILRAVTGAWLLAQGDRRGMQLFDLSVEGFWKSFTAALLVAPVYALLLAEEYARLGWPEQIGATISTRLVAFVLGWFSFPVAAIFLTRMLHLGSRYVPLIVANNWSAVLQVSLYFGASIVGFVLPAHLQTIVLFAVTIAVLVYQWFVVRTALETTGGVAIGVVVIDLLLSILVSRAVDAVL